MNKIKTTISVVVRLSFRIISYTLFAPAFLVAKFVELIDPIFDDVEDKMGW